MDILFYYLLIVNGIAFIITGYDKYLAIHKKNRISENTLFAIAIVGGSVGLALAMLLFRHKTNKPSFIIKFSMLFLIQILGVLLKFVIVYNTESVFWFLSN